MQLNRTYLYKTCIKYGLKSCYLIFIYKYKVLYYKLFMIVEVFQLHSFFGRQQPYRVNKISRQGVRKLFL